MKKTFLILVFGTAFCSTNVYSQSKTDIDSIQKEALNKEKDALEQQKKALDLQVAALDKQREALNNQKTLAAAQEVLAEKQAVQAKAQKKMMQSFKEELLKDGLIKENEDYELIINSREMVINGKNQSEKIHQKYLDLIKSKRNKPLGEKEEWRIKN